MLPVNITDSKGGQSAAFAVSAAGCTTAGRAGLADFPGEINLSIGRQL